MKFDGYDVNMVSYKSFFPSTKSVEGWVKMEKVGLRRASFDKLFQSGSV